MRTAALRLVTMALVLTLAMPATAGATFSEEGVLSGSVYTFEDGAPLAGIEVRAHRWEDEAASPLQSQVAETVTAVTGDDGSYRFEGLVADAAYTIEFVDSEGARARMAYPQSGFRVEDAGRFIPSAIDFEVDAYLPTRIEAERRLSNRIAGSDRYATGIEISKANFASADTVVLVTGANFPDALAASPLAGLYDAPLLLTMPDKVPAGLIAEMKRLAAGAGLSAPRVIIVGGTASVSQRVVDELKRAGISEITRFSGADRYEVAAKVAQFVQSRSPNKEPFLCRGDVFADALAVAPFAYMERRPILLTPTTGFSRATHPTNSAWRQMRGPADDFMMLVGGPSSMTGEVADSIVAISGSRFFDRDGDPSTVDPSNVWLHGADRYETAEAVISFYREDYWQLSGGWDGFGVAAGDSFADALTGGAACGHQNMPLLLTARGSLSVPTERVLRGSGADVINVEVFGGRNVVSDTVMSAARTAVTQAPGRR